MSIKKSVWVRLDGTNVYGKHIEVDPSKLTNIMKFPKEAFAEIDGIRIAIHKEDFEKLIEENEKVIEKTKRTTSSN